MGAVSAEAAELGELVGRLPHRDGLSAERLHAVHEVEHVAPLITGEAMEELLLEVHRAAWSLIVMEGAKDLDLFTLSNRGETIVRKHDAEVCTSFELIKVDTR